MAKRKAGLFALDDASGTTPPRAQSVSVKNTHASATITLTGDCIDDVELPAGESVSWGGSPGDEIDSITVDASSSTALVSYLLP